MAGFLGDDQVRRIKDAIDIVQLMGEYAPLRKAGRNFSCCCPFHQERSPSCHVYPDDQHYYCFGCGARGDVISLVKDKENLSFGEAVELLARRAGIQLEYEKGSGGMPRGERDALIAACQFACQFYEQVLWTAPEAAAARDYLASRRLGRAVCERFRIGWAPGAGQLVAAGKRKGINADLLARIDLALERNGTLTDRFFERVTFPICDRFGNPIAFSARLLPEAERAAKEAGRGVGKYVNNTDTPLYHKGSSVFNLHHARTAARDAGRLIVMEGPTDVMAADQAGYHECVAVLGTALTPEHAKMLGALVGNQGRLILLLDGDRAGQTNALKGIRTCLAVGVPVRVAILPDELDPAELLAENETGATPESKATFERVLASARPDLDHLLRVLAPRPHELERRDKMVVIDQVLDAVRPMPDAELKALCLRDISEYMDIEHGLLIKRLAEGAGKAPARAEAEELPSDEPQLPPLDKYQETLLHLLVRVPDLRVKAADDLALEPSHLPAPWSELVAELLLHPDADGVALRSSAVVSSRPGLRPAVERWQATPFEASLNVTPEALPDCVRKIRKDHCERTLKRIRAQIIEAERSKRHSEIGDLMDEQKVQLQLLQDLNR
jgi:DNA primase catalytic core